MPDYAYVGLDTAGRERRGSVRADTADSSPRAARLAQSLRRGIEPRTERAGRARLLSSG